MRICPADVPSGARYEPSFRHPDGAGSHQRMVVQLFPRQSQRDHTPRHPLQVRYGARSVGVEIAYLASDAVYQADVTQSPRPLLQADRQLFQDLAWIAATFIQQVGIFEPHNVEAFSPTGVSTSVRHWLPPAWSVPHPVVSTKH